VTPDKFNKSVNKSTSQELELTFNSNYDSNSRSNLRSISNENIGNINTININNVNEMPNLFKLEQPVEIKKKHNFKLNLKKIIQPNNNSKTNINDQFEQDHSQEHDDLDYDRDNKNYKNKPDDNNNSNVTIYNSNKHLRNKSPLNHVKSAHELYKKTVSTLSPIYNSLSMEKDLNSKDKYV